MPTPAPVDAARIIPPAQRLTTPSPPPPSPPPKSYIQKPVPSKAKLGGRDVSPARARSGSSKTIAKTAIERFSDNRENETQHLSRKHECVHELKMAEAENKCLKYEIRGRDSAGEWETHLKELRLQIQLAQVQRGLPSTIPDPTSSPLAQAHAAQ